MASENSQHNRKLRSPLVDRTNTPSPQSSSASSRWVRRCSQKSGEEGERNEGFKTPQAVIRGPGEDTFIQSDGKIPDSSSSSCLRVYSKRQDQNVLSKSCPPLGRTRASSRKSARPNSPKKSYLPLGAVKRPATICVTEAPQPKKARMLQTSSVPPKGVKSLVPESFVKEQKAHFAEIDLFELQEEDYSGNSS